MREAGEKLKIGDVMDRLKKASLLTSEEAERLMKSVHDESLRNVPLAFKILTGFGAALAAAFFSAFLAATELISFDSAAQLASFGAILVASAVLLFLWQAKQSGAVGVFGLQIAFLLILAGKGLFIFSFLTDMQGDEGYFAAALGASIITALTYPFFREPTERFLSVVAAGMLFVRGIHEGDSTLAEVFFVLATIAVIGFALVRSKTPRVYAVIGYGGLVTLLLYFLLSSYEQLWSWTGGFLAAIGFLILGHARQDRAVTALTCLFFATYMSRFYYELNVTLLDKSLLLMGSGAGLLMGAILVREWQKGRS